MEPSAPHFVPPASGRGPDEPLALHPRIMWRVGFIAPFQVVEQIDEIQVVQLEPLGDRGDRAPAALGEGRDDLPPQLGIEDFTDADHDGYSIRHDLCNNGRIAAGG